MALFMSGGAKGIGTQAEGIISGPCVGCAEGIVNVKAGASCNAPTVTGVSPASGPAAGGTNVTVTGTNFTGATVVNFGPSNPATFSVTNPTTISVPSSPSGSGTVDVTVTTPCGTSAISAADEYTYNAYVGPGDIVTQTVFYSCARAYSISYANGTNPLCDLVPSGGGGAVCTLRAATSGYVDLSAYCSGQTPAAACAAASGGSCNVSNAYNQLGATTLNAVEATSGNQPSLIFSDQNSLPCMRFVAGSSQHLTSPGTQAFSNGSTTFTGVAKRTAVTGFAGIIEVSNAGIGWTSVASTMTLFAGSVGSFSGSVTTDNAFHAFQGLFNTTSSAAYVDGTAFSSLNAGSGTISGAISIGEINGSFVTGDICEAGIAASLMTAPQQSSVNTNQHSAYGF